MGRPIRMIAAFALASLLFTPHAGAQQPTDGRVGNAYWHADLYGGFLHSDADNAIGFNIPNNGGPLRSANPEDFGFAGVTLGRQFSGAGPLKSAEAYFEAVFEEDDRVDTGNNYRFVSTKGNTLITTVGPPAFGTAERSRIEGGLHLRLGPAGEGERRDGWNWLLTGFGGEGKESTNREIPVDLGGGLGRPVNSTDLEFAYGGLMGGFEGRVPLSRTVTLRTSFQGGFAYYDADAHLSSARGASPAAVAIVGLWEQERDDESNHFGMRGRGRAELEKSLGSNIALSVFGLVDFWSSMPTLKNTGPFGAFTQVEGQNVMELRAGARLRVKFGGTNQADY